MSTEKRRLKKFGLGRTVVPLGVAALVGSLLAVGVRSAHAADQLLSQGRQALASSQENGETPAAAAVDGRSETRWSSQWSDPQWLRIDLGGTAAVSQVLGTA